MKRILLQPAYVLHRRSYRESSFLVELFTCEQGRLTVIARGVRKAKSSSQGLLQPFVPLLVSCSGNGELMTLSQVEANGSIKPLRGANLFAGFYLNELLMYLLQKWDAHPDLFSAYKNTLSALQSGSLKQKTLRAFEKYLLEELGYGPLPKIGTSLSNTFLPDKYYRFIPEEGFVLCEGGDPSEIERSRFVANVFSGKNLLAIAEEDWQDEVVLQDAKRLMRFVYQPLLGTRRIYSRQLFITPEEEKVNEE